ncbi:hypothetical protein BKA67DRAFT_530942 [Truncatella angustata]|uniref:Uncharacterized protein n=1 Tax=Truncatella angustata TaxID=152316 RepID=A0A9P9A476_9PEZI|nr:uncharacterized protein BKA67DRAFT_530942 [Truncatella angustata]KAH6660858.1 hypothetical protein BKA67DRAFT_530942 [Truncatella angustata]KAH8199256.1 hypothetical protein TruAng_006596 [Truncatella angustata]
MSLLRDLVKPLVIEAKEDHSHTVVFLHRFPAGTTDDELRTKVLSEKKPGFTVTLQRRYPTLRWVFPYPKLHSGEHQHRTSHWESLSATDVATLELEDNGLPYITQIILREARLVGGLDKVIVGGQGETAIAAHAAINRFPEIPSRVRNEPTDVVSFLQQTFPGSWTEASQFKLAGFVAMHAADDEATQDQRTYLLMSRFANKKTIKDNITLNTPHKFIHGGIKRRDDQNDGPRIVEFSDFLSSIGVPIQTKLVASPIVQIEPQRVVPRFTKAVESTAKEEDDAKLRHELAEKEKYRQLLEKKKRQEADARKRTLQRIEEDKIERKIRQERERRRIFGPDISQTLPDECNPQRVDSKLEDELAEREKYRQLLKKQKQQEAEARQRALMRIEDDKIERKIRQERERQKLFGHDVARGVDEEDAHHDSDHDA